MEHRQVGRGAAQGRNDLQSFLNLEAEVGRAGNQVGVVQVVGMHPEPNQRAEQLGQQVGIVVDPSQQHRLVVEWQPRVRQHGQGRAGLGIKTFNITKKTGRVAAAEIVDDSKEVYVVSEQAQVLRTNLSEIRSIGRITQGVTIFKPQPGDSVSSIACVKSLDSIEESKEPAPKASTNGKGNGQLSLNAID